MVRMQAGCGGRDGLSWVFPFHHTSNPLNHCSERRLQPCFKPPLDYSISFPYSHRNLASIKNGESQHQGTNSEMSHWIWLYEAGSFWMRWSLVWNTEGKTLNKEDLKSDLRQRGGGHFFLLWGTKTNICSYSSDKTLLSGVVSKWEMKQLYGRVHACDACLFATRRTQRTFLFLTPCEAATRLRLDVWDIKMGKDEVKFAPQSWHFARWDTENQLQM